jgi:hypothetical protein
MEPWRVFLIMAVFLSLRHALYVMMLWAFLPATLTAVWYYRREITGFRDRFADAWGRITWRSTFRRANFRWLLEGGRSRDKLKNTSTERGWGVS